MVIDAHSHLFQERHATELAVQASRDCARVPGLKLHSAKRSVHELGIDPEHLRQKMDEADITKIVTLPQEMTRIHGWSLGSNELAADLQRNFPDRIIGVASVEPLDERGRFNAIRIRQFEEAVKRDNLRGLLLTPPYGYYYADDKCVYPFYQKANELKVPVFFHQAAQIDQGNYPGFLVFKYCRPYVLDEVIADFPDMKMLLEHIGFPWTQEVLAMMMHAQNIYSDIASLFSRPTILAWNLMMAKEYGVLDRILYASDHIGTNLDEYAAQVVKEAHWCRTRLNQILEKAGWPTLTSAEIDGILGGNAKRLLDLTP
jgi:predicted TIM-barrel fold metal-dependent hydrolase